LTSAPDGAGCRSVTPGLIPLAERIAGHETLRFRGLQAYEGHAVHRDSREVRATLVRQAALHIQHEQARLAAAGFGCPVVSGGGTGTYDLAAQAGVLTRSRPVRTC
jgi:3-hydroxy-D-aspartate aldolase